MKSDIVLAGVGGQGILSIAATIGMAAINNNLHLKQAEVHGMSQRGGAVQSHLRVSDKPIASDLIPMGKADIIISVEPMESLRYLPFLGKEGWIVTNTTPYVNIPDYPELDDVMAEIEKYPRNIRIDADAIAKEVATARASNIVMLGAASPFLNIDLEHFEKGLEMIFGRKGEDVVKMNIAALHAGREFAQKNR